jgi:hypothetical protein
VACTTVHEPENFFGIYALALRKSVTDARNYFSLSLTRFGFAKCFFLARPAIRLMLNLYHRRDSVFLHIRPAAIRYKCWFSFSSWKPSVPKHSGRKGNLVGIIHNSQQGLTSTVSSESKSVHVVCMRAGAKPAPTGRIRRRHFL